MFGIGATEFILLLLAAVVMFGPEKIPEFSRKAARIYVYLRDVSNTAQTQLRKELGPEYADLEIKDLNPKTFVAKHLRSEIAMIDDAKREITNMTSQVKSAAKLATSEAADAKELAKASATTAADEMPVLFDAEAT